MYIDDPNLRFYTSRIWINIGGKTLFRLYKYVFRDDKSGCVLLFHHIMYFFDCELSLSGFTATALLEIRIHNTKHQSKHLVWHVSASLLRFILNGNQWCGLFWIFMKPMMFRLQREYWIRTLKCLLKQNISGVHGPFNLKYFYQEPSLVHWLAEHLKRQTSHMLSEWKSVKNEDRAPLKVLSTNLTHEALLISPGKQLVNVI